jgi:hypothetical protein
MTDENMMKAIQYGIANKQEKKTLYQLVDPWLIPEKALKNPYRQKESIFVYTPYLLAAIHARDKVEESRVPEPADIRKAIQEYDGITLIGARLNTPVVLQEGEYTVRLVQEKTNLAPYASNYLHHEMISKIDKKDEGKKAGQADDGKQLTRNEKKEENTAKTEKVTVLEMQFYFDSSQFNPAQPYTVLISDKYCGERRFDVNPAAIR